MDLGDPGTASDPLGRFCARLKRLQTQSGIKQADLLGAAGLKRSQVSDILNGKIERPPDWGVTMAMVRACLEHAKAASRLVPPDLSDDADWQRRYFDLEQDLDTGTRAKSRREGPAGRLLAEVNDPFALEVHRPVEPNVLQPGLPTLPAYLAREHDVALQGVTAAAARGVSGIAVLVGGSSTGKTRACWEALRLLRGRPEPWRLWHPIAPTRPEAALRELASIGPRTVIWLNEAQFYLDTAADGPGERVAAGLRELLRDPSQAPVLVLATLWPQYWDALTARPAAGADPHAQARELLAGQDIRVPPAFSEAQLEQAAALADPRLARAAEGAESGQVIQFLAGAPELMARYRNAPPAAAALIDAAMDARRLGMGIALPLAFLQEAAPGYLADADWDLLGEDWLEQALAYTAAPCQGIRGPLARIRPRSPRGPGRAREPAYRLADYLDQHGRRARHSRIPPADFWTAAARFAHPSDLPALAISAWQRGLLRDANRIRKYATAQGNASEAEDLVRELHSLHPHTADPRPARWAAAHAALDDPGAVASLVSTLRTSGAERHAADLLARDPAAHTRLHSPYGVASLLGALQAAGAEQQVSDLLARDPAAHAVIDDPYGVITLLRALREAGAGQQAADLATRAAAHTSLDNPGATAHLLRALREAGAGQQAADLATRAAAHAALDKPYGLAGMTDVAPPLVRAAFEDGDGFAELLNSLREAGAEQQAADLATRAAAQAALDKPYRVTRMMDALREAGAGQQAADLATRAAAHTSLDDPGAIAHLLDRLRETGADQQVSALLARDPAADAALNDPWGVAQLLDALREAGAEQQVSALLARDPAAHAALANGYRIARLLRALQEAEAEQQAADLATRAAAHVAVNDPRAVAYLLDGLREAGAEQQVSALLARDPAAHTALDDSFGVADLLSALRASGAEQQVSALLARDPATHAVLDDEDHVIKLLDALRAAGAEQQHRTLIARLHVEGFFAALRYRVRHETQYTFGCEPDGTPAPPWGWDDLD